jgi:hypothetical protein
MVKRGRRLALSAEVGGYAREIGRWQIKRNGRHSEGDTRVGWLKGGYWWANERYWWLKGKRRTK